MARVVNQISSEQLSPHGTDFRKQIYGTHHMVGHHQSGKASSIITAPYGRQSQ